MNKRVEMKNVDRDDPAIRSFMILLQLFLKLNIFISHLTGNVNQAGRLIQR